MFVLQHLLIDREIQLVLLEKNYDNIKGVVSLNSFCSSIGGCCNLEGATLLLFNQNSFLMQHPENQMPKTEEEKQDLLHGLQNAISEISCFFTDQNMEDVQRISLDLFLAFLRDQQHHLDCIEEEAEFFTRLQSLFRSLNNCNFRVLDFCKLQIAA